MKEVRNGTHGSARSPTTRPRHMTGERRICLSTRRWRQSRSMIPFAHRARRQDRRLAFDALTIRWPSCIHITRSTKRSIRGGRAFQNDWEKAERGPRAVDPTRERVDGGQMREPITEGQRRAVVRLNRVEHELGADGTVLVHEVLILGMTMEQVGERRGLSTPALEGLFCAALPGMSRSACAGLRLCGAARASPSKASRAEAQAAAPRHRPPCVSGTA